MSEPWEEFSGSATATEEPGPWTAFAPGAGADAAEPWKEFQAEEKQPPANVREIMGSPMGSPEYPTPRDAMELAAQNFQRRQKAGLPAEGLVSGQDPMVMGGTTITPVQGGIGLPHIRPPSDAGTMEKIAAGTYNTAAGIPNFMLSLPGLATALAPELLSARIAGPALKGLFLGLLAKGTGEAAGTASVTKDPQDITEAVGAGAMTGLVGATKGEVTGRELPGPSTPKPKFGLPSTKIVSEFGGDLDRPVPEQPGTLAAQLEWVKQGKRPAVLVTPGEAAPEVPEGMATHPTAAGVFIFDPAKTTPAAIDAAVKENKIGALLGYGIDSKPEGANATVTVRGPDGTEKQAVVTDQANAGNVIAAAKQASDPGDAVQIEHAGDVVADRQGPSTMVRKALREAAAAREPVPVSLVQEFNKASDVPWAVPEGYELEGDRYVFKGGGERLTPEQQAARANAEAMAALRKQKEENTDPDWDIPDEPAPAGPTERVEGGTPMVIEGERPPDILDWIGDNFRGGVKIGARADYGEYLKGATGRAKELLSATKGEAADQVLKEMHDQGLYKRIDSPDALLQAMVDAGEARKGFEAQRRQSRDAVEAWFERAIAATKPDTGWTGEASMGLLRVPVWLAQEAAHGALQVAKLAYTTTRDLAQAIAAAVDHVRGMNLPGFNAGELQSWLQGQLGERATGQKIADSDVVTDPVKHAIGEYLYEKRTNATDEELASGIVDQVGVDGAEKLLRDPPANLAQATWGKLLAETTRRLAEQEREARTNGDAAGAAQLAQRQAQLWDEALPKITEMAQGLQALNDIVDMSPDAQVARLKNRIERTGNEELQKRRAETEQMRGALDQGRAAGVEELRQDPEVNGAARAAVDATIAESPQVKQAVVMELADEWAKVNVMHPEKGLMTMLEHARLTVRERANEILSKTEKAPGMSARAHLDRILTDLAGRAAQIFAGHLQGAEPGVSIVEKLAKRLGLTNSRARELATSLSQEWDRQLKAAQAKLPKRIASMRATRERNAGQLLSSPTAAVDARIRKELGDLNVKLGQVLREEAGRRDQTGQHVAERVVQASGLTGEAADTLRTILKNRWDALVTDAQRRTLEQMQRASGISVSKPLKGAFEKLVELDRLGALTGDKFYDVVKKSLELKQLTQADAAELRRLVQKAQDLPEGYLRQTAAAEVLKLTERLGGNMKWWDVPMAIFYANILSGFTTPAKIVLENMNLLASSTVASLLTRPRDLTHPIDLVRDLVGSYKRGLAKGALQAASTLKTGVVSGVWKDARVPTILEMKPFGARLEPLNFWKWFTRGISTAHETTFKPAWEVKQTMIARDLARKEGLSGPALNQRVADLMANTDKQVSDARAQAVADLQAAGQMSKLNLARRTREILEQRRESNMPGSSETARDFALRTAYLSEPYGFMGLVARWIRSTLEEARKQYPALGMGVKTQIPFTTIVANILNEKLNWTPTGLLRAAISHRTGELYGRPVLPGDRAELYAKAIVGTAALGVMATLFGEHIHGNGPGDPRKRKQLSSAGWIPHSIEMNGKYYSYMNTPEGVGLAVIGNWLDWHRYSKGNEADGVSRGAFALKATINAIVSQGMLDSLKRLFESLGNENTSEGADKLQKQLARTAGSAVVPNLVQQIDRMFDPTVYDQTGMEALVKSQIPFVRRDNKPVLNVLGESVESGPFHFWASKQTEDLLWPALVAKQAWIPEPGRDQVIGVRKKGPDFFRAMTPDEYYEWIALSGPRIRARLMENLDRITLDEPSKVQAFVRKVADEERKEAKKNFE